MTDGHPTHDDRPRERRFDDDRLLAFALGLDDDPELAAAAAGDERLRRRLDAMRAEIGGVATQLDAAVPAPGGDYADPTGVRWAGLREFYQPPAPPRSADARGGCGYSRRSRPSPSRWRSAPASSGTSTTAPTRRLATARRPRPSGRAAARRPRLRCRPFWPHARRASPSSCWRARKTSPARSSSSQWCGLSRVMRRRCSGWGSAVSRPRSTDSTSSFCARKKA